MRRNNIDAHDSLIDPMGDATFTDDFFDISSYRESKQQVYRSVAPDEIFSSGFYLDDSEVTLTREVYNFFDFLGDIGGIFDLLVMVMGIFMFRISEFSYNLKVFEKIYLVRTKDPNLVGKKSGRVWKTKKISIPDDLQDTPLAKEVDTHHPIHLSYSN